MALILLAEHSPGGSLKDTVGFDLTAKRPKRGAEGYYRSGIEFMSLLRCAMVAAGVPEALVYRKFVSNDDRLVTRRESQMIAEKLTSWLHGRNLVLELAERNERARVSVENLQYVQQAVGSRQEASRIARRLRADTLTLRVDRKARRSIRDFAVFCDRSGGFYVS